MLLIELDGLQDGLDRLADHVVEICKLNHVREVSLAKTAAERDQLWVARKGAFGATGRLRPNYLVNDGTVPRTKLPETLKRVGEIGKKYDVAIANVFHAGDGNLHPLILFDERDKDELARVHKAAFEIMQLCVEMGGTITGEHGVGVEKLEGLKLQFCSADITALQNVKQAFDPDNVLNPGKLIPRKSDSCGGKEIVYAEH
jgi:glycolate oxidase